MYVLYSGLARLISILITSLAYSVCGGNAVGLLGSLQAQCAVQNYNCGMEQAGSSTSLLIGLKGHTL